MKVIRFTTFPPDSVRALVDHASARIDELTDARFGGDLPTRMLFPPEQGFPASLHYMFFPRGTRQDFHWHPGGRHLLLLGDTTLTIRSNPCGVTQNPHGDARHEVVSPFTMAFVRFAAGTWHEFSATASEGTGIIAFSFHDTDDLISTDPSLMEELTTFWRDDGESVS